MRSQLGFGVKCCDRGGLLAYPLVVIVGGCMDLREVIILDAGVYFRSIIRHILSY